MRDYLKRGLELAKLYRSRLARGLLCGALSGVLAPTLALSLKLAVDAVFPQEKVQASTGPDAGGQSAPGSQNAAIAAKDGSNTTETDRNKKNSAQIIASLPIPAPIKKWMANFEH